MRRNYFFVFSLFFLLACHLDAWADREVNQLQLGKQTIEVGADEVISFYDPWGTDDIVDKNSYNAQSLTVFKPATEGMSVQITFETIDLNQYSNSYYLYMNVYDGIADADDSFTWAESTSDVTSSSSLSAMSGTMLAEAINNSNKPALPATYTSASANGALSVGFMHRNSNQCEGWVAKVRCVTLKNMTVTGAGSNYDGIAAVPSTRQNVPLAHAYVTAEGVMNPDNVTGIYFTLTQNEGVVDPTALKLFKNDKQVEATVTAEAEGYLFTLNEAPSDGTTTFTIYGNILGTAAIGAKVQVDITKVATATKPEGIKPFAAGTPVEVENPALVNMSATPQTISVGEATLQFYDEGGKDGNIAANTNGQVTFVPAADGKKVMVNFTKNAIWHGSYYNQELRIYNGTEVSAENLIKTLQQGETGTVRSTADDGSLTVVLFSDASATTAADGFEAEVSLFTPLTMDFDSLVVSQYATGTVCAGDADQRILDISVKTKNTEPALLLTKMAFTANGTNDNVVKAALFYGSKKIGETDITADAFDIALTEAQPLVEGDNNFYLAYTISDEVLNGQTIDATLVSVTAQVNGAEKTEVAAAGNPEGNRIVENIVLSQASQGLVAKTVNGTIAFNTKNTSEYSSYCEAGTDERINTFVPKHEGMVCQIDFTEFNVQYASSSWGNKSTFKIYAGQGTDGTLLWELNDNALESVGPDHTIRSTAEDGALTIVFNPNTSYSYYYTGFKATVSEYLSKDMQIAGVEVSQATAAIASVGAENQDLLNVNVKTDGNLNPMQLSSIKLNLKETETSLSKVSVWMNDEKLGEADADAEVEVIFSEPATLKEGNNLFAVKADVSSEAEAEDTIDAKVVAVTTTGGEIAVADGDPEGSRTLKNMIILAAGDNGEKQIALGKTIMLYDDGGAEGDGADGIEATITFAPAEAGHSVKLTDKGISFAYTAHLYIYEGGEANDDKLIVDLTGSSAKFDPIISDTENSDGKLTIKYVGKGSYTRPNFAIEVEGYKKSEVAITGVETEDISTGEVLKGQTDVKMLKIAVTAKGELGSVSLTGFNVASTSSEATSAQHIYQTGTLASFSANETFNGEYTITGSGTYYFWLTYDLSTDAEVGQTADAQLTAITADGETISVADPVTASVSVATGKSGTYTVGADADYATIQGAIDDMGTLGMEGPVVLRVKAGSYNEKVRIPYIKGMGAVNTLTIESESGQRDVKIYDNNYMVGGYSDDQHKKDYGVVTLYQASYVTLRNLEICTDDKAYKAVVMVKDESRHVTIEDCYLHAPLCTATGEDVCLVGHTIIDEENKNNDYLTVRGCLLEGGKMGVSMGGTNYVSLPKEVGGVIEGNTFKNNAQKAIYVMDELGLKIRNNTIIIESTAATKMSVGILDMQLRDEHAEATEITGNIFNVAPVSYCAVMNLRQLIGTADAPVVIANNVINLASLNASYSAIKLNGGNIKNVNVANNTVRMTGENGGAAFWAASTLGEGYGNVNVVNNIIQNETNGYAVNLYNDGNLGTDKINFQNNLMYTAGETFFRASSSTTGDFAAFVEATGATNCINKQTVFVSNEILEPAGTLEGDLLTAQPLSYVTTDINGTVRPETGITLGAYEYDTDLTRIPVIAENYPTATAIDWHTAMIAVRADMNATAYVTVLPAGAEAPTAANLQEAGTPLTLTKDTEATLNVDTLQEQTAYVAYVLAVSTRGNATEVFSTEAFTTPMQPIDLLIACTEPTTTVASGSDTELKVMVASGLAPFTVSWTDSKHQPVGEAVTTDLLGEEITQVLTALQSGDYYVTVTDAQQKTASDTCRIIVTGDAHVADFENLYLAENSFWRGPDTKGSIEEGLYGDSQYQGSFVSGSYQFANNYSIDWASWSGFSYANRTATDFSSYATDQWNACTGQGANGSENYAVFFEDQFAPMTVSVLNNAEGDTIRGFYITNAAVTVNSILNGDGQTGEKDADGNPVDGTVGFKQGDWFKLTVTADNDEELEYYLADYRSENADEHYYVSQWQWLDLSSLGRVKELTFHLESSRKNSWGYTTPLYFCMDNLGGEAPAEPIIYEGPATMEDIALQPESYWNGSDGTGAFISGAYKFENGYEESEWGAYAYGFYCSNMTSTDFAAYATDQYNSCVGHGAEGSANYAVFNVNEWTPKGVEVLSSEEGDTISGFYVTNAASAYTSMMNGDAVAKQFGTGDWFKLTITGIDAQGEETGSVDFYLADLRDAANAYILSDWRWVDLTSLGRVKRLAFSMSSSDDGQWGMNTPAYFCLDNLGGQKPESEEPIPTFIAQQAAEADHTPVAIYNMGGVRQNALQPGMNIVKYANGTTRKVFVK